MHVPCRQQILKGYVANIVAYLSLPGLLLSLINSVLLGGHSWKPLIKQGSGTSIYQPPGATTTNHSQPSRSVFQRTDWTLK